MSKYIDSLQHYCVVVDGESINAAAECNRLHKENMRLKTMKRVARQKTEAAFLATLELNNYVKDMGENGG